MESRYGRTIEDKYTDVLRTAKETEEIASATCVTLKQQTDTINRITEKSYEISANVDKSERIVRGMNGFFGKVKNFFSKSKPTDPRPKDINPQQNNLASVGDISVKNSRYIGNAGSVEVNRKKNDDDYFIEQLTFSANNLKSMAENISVTLDEHNQKLDKVSDLTQKNNDRIERLNYKAKRLMN